MAHPVYVLLPEGVEWTVVLGTHAQAPAPVRWYLRQSMPTAATQTGVLVDDGDELLEERLAAVAQTAEQLGGIAIDARTQEQIPADGAPTKV